VVVLGRVAPLGQEVVVVTFAAQEAMDLLAAGGVLGLAARFLWLSQLYFQKGMLEAAVGVPAVASMHPDDDSLLYVPHDPDSVLLARMTSSSRPSEVREEVVVLFEPRWTPRLFFLPQKNRLLLAESLALTPSALPRYHDHH
jgi:hypothetical protein